MTFDTYLRRRHNLTWNQWDSKTAEVKNAIARDWLAQRDRPDTRARAGNAAVYVLVAVAGFLTVVWTSGWWG